MWWSKCVLVLVTLLLVLDGSKRPGAEARGGRGGGGRGGSRGGSRGSSRGRGGGGTSSYTKTRSRYNSATSLISGSRVIQRAVVLGILYKGTRRSRKMYDYPETDDFYIFIDSSKLENNFTVNGNNLNTRFLLSLDYEVWISCLTVPRRIDAGQCPKTFRTSVSRNAEFYVPSFYDNLTTPEVYNKSHINLCCVTGAASRDVIATSPLLLLTLFAFALAQL